VQKSEIGVNIKRIILILILIYSSAYPKGEQENISWIPENIYLYAAQGVDNNLREMPGDIISFALPTENTYLYGIGSFIPFYIGSPQEYSGLELGLTSVLVKHSGIQSHIEIDAALTMKYKELFPKNRYLNIDLAFGYGLSYAFDTPIYEDTEVGELKYYRLQNYMHFDAEFYTSSFESIHLLLRIHHRSGTYGLTAPSGVGSNFVGAGVVYYFDHSK